MDHIFFTDFSVDAHLGYFCVLAVVNSAAVKTGVHASFCIMSFTGYMPRNEVAGSDIKRNLRLRRNEMLGKG